MNDIACRVISFSALSFLIRWYRTIESLLGWVWSRSCRTGSNRACIATSARKLPPMQSSSVPAQCQAHHDECHDNLHYYSSPVRKNLSSKFDKISSRRSKFDTDHRVDFYAHTCCQSATFGPLFAFIALFLTNKIINNFARCDVYVAVFAFFRGRLIARWRNGRCRPVGMSKLGSEGRCKRPGANNMWVGAYPRVLPWVLYNNY